MKKILLGLLLIVGLNSYSQEVADSTRIKQLRKEVRLLNQDAWGFMGMGVIAHGIGFGVFVNPQPLKDPNNVGIFALNNTIGISLDVLVITKFRRIRKKKREIKALGG